MILFIGLIRVRLAFLQRFYLNTAQGLFMRDTYTPLRLLALLMTFRRDRR